VNESASVQSGGETSGLVINRPLRRGIDTDLAQLILNGYGKPIGTKAGREGAGGADLVDLPFMLKFLQAFGGKGSVYFGGPEAQAEKGVMIHGIADLDGKP
jgi:hypothetical protein